MALHLLLAYNLHIVGLFTHTVFYGTSASNVSGYLYKAHITLSPSLFRLQNCGQQLKVKAGARGSEPGGGGQGAHAPVASRLRELQ